MSLSDRQFTQLASQANDPKIGGFSAATQGKDAGKAPKDRFMVGQGKEETTPSGAMTGGDVKDFAARNAQHLARADHFAGGWSHEGTGYLDVSKGFPRTGQGESKARLSTVENNEIAYGEMDNKRNYAGDHANPFHPANNQGDITNSGEADQKKAWVEMPATVPRSKKNAPLDLGENQSFS